MGTSLNGWPGIKDGNDPRLTWIAIPGTHKKVCVRKETAPLFAAIFSEINTQVLALDPGPLDGWEYREARTKSGLSNHASGTAVDFRYDVLKADHERHMTDAQIAAMHKLLNKYVTSKGKRVFGWGGDWKVGKYCDEMHVEIIQSWSPGSQGSNGTPEDCADAIKFLGINSDGTFIGTTPVPTPTPPPSNTPVLHVANVQPGKTNSEVKVLQKALSIVGLNPGGIDGAFGPKTKAAYAKWQTSLGYKGTDADGAPGKTSLTALANKTKTFTVAN
jgi:hypothetical protein